jgi:hypothetical protein
MWLVVTLIGLLGCMAFGAWPLVVCRQLAPVWRGTMGTLCVLAGTIVFAGVCSANAWADSGEAKAGELKSEGGEPVAETGTADAEASEATIPDSAPSSSSDSQPDKLGAASDENAPSKESKGASASSTIPSTGEVVESSDAIEIETAPEGVIIPPGRPSWVEAPPMHIGEIHTTSVSSGPFARAQDCWREFDNQLEQATDEYIAEHLGESFATQFIQYDAKTIRTRLLKPENIYHEQIVVSIGPMHQVHGLLEFKPEFRSELDQRWAQVTRYSRLTQVGLGSFAFLALLSVVFGYFRLDNATRGYYTGRLQFLTAAAILAIVGVGVVAARWVVWM